MTTANTALKPVLQAVGVDKSFGITHAVNRVSLDLYRGEIRGLIGENGSGKSTFCSLLTGIHKLDGGHFLIDGDMLAVRNQIEANNRGVSIIVQETGTLPGLTVAENIFLGNEKQFTRFGVKNTRAMNRRAQKLLDDYGFSHIRAAQAIESYNFENRKLVEIVKATYFKPLVLIVDETTTALSQSGRDELYKIMQETRADNRTVIFISHDLPEVLSHTDNISVLRDGELIDTVKSAGTTEDDLKRLMVGRVLDDRYYRKDYGERQAGSLALSVRGLSVPGQFDDLDLDLYKGEILGIGGLSECGMHEVGKAIFGASYHRTGSVTLADGSSINTVTEAIRKGIAYASKDREMESLVVNTTIKDNIILPTLSQTAAVKPLNHKALKRFAVKYANQLSVKMTGVEQYVNQLSGGNKQKVVLARWLGKDSDIYILDSPTRGIDVKVKADIYALMSDLRSQGKSILMISEEMQELMGMCDRILIMKEGRINAEFARSRDLREEDIIQKML